MNNIIKELESYFEVVIKKRFEENFKHGQFQISIDYLGLIELEKIFDKIGLEVHEMTYTSNLIYITFWLDQSYQAGINQDFIYTCRIGIPNDGNFEAILDNDILEEDWYTTLNYDNKHRMDLISKKLDVQSVADFIKANLQTKLLSI
jgi:hypothetical protein